MRLHRYFPAHADTTLEEGRLRLSKVSAFNDPFEFVTPFHGTPTPDQAYHDLQESMTYDEAIAFAQEHRKELSSAFTDEQISENPHQILAEHFTRTGGTPRCPHEESHKTADSYFRILCFSKTDVSPESEILLWSHYAQKHSGVRLEFDFGSRNDHRFREICYSSHRPSINYQVSDNLDYADEAMGRGIFTKSLGWSYEHEVRYLAAIAEPDSKIDRSEEIHHIPFTPDTVRSVDFGLRCEQTTIETISTIVRSKYPGTKLRKCEMDRYKYRLNYVDL